MLIKVKVHGQRPVKRRRQAVPQCSSQVVVQDCRLENMEVLRAMAPQASILVSESIIDDINVAASAALYSGSRRCASAVAKIDPRKKNWDVRCLRQFC